jgi:hypothetical protein
MNNDPAQNPKATAEKFATQAETGEGRSMARPGGGGALQPGNTDSSSLSGNFTNDAMPEGGATGDRPMPDTVKPERGA